MRFRNHLLVCMAGVASPFVASAAPFTPGNLVVVRTGDQTYASDASAGTVYLDEYNPSTGLIVQSIPMNDGNNTTTSQYTLPGGDGQNGFISRSYNGQYFVMGGYDAVLGTPGLASTSGTGQGGTVDRLIARIDMSGNIDTSTRMTDWNANNGPYSAASVDGTSYWTSGAGSANQVRYTVHGATTSTRITTSSNINAKVVNIFQDADGDPQLYVSRGSNTNVVNTVTHAIDPNPKLPTTTHSSGNPVVVSPVATESGASTYDFFFLDDSTMYKTDDNNSALGGIIKYTRSGTVWTKQYVLQAGLSSVPLRGITGYRYGNGTPILFATSGNGNNLVSIVDSGPNSTFTTIANLDSLGNMRFHDVVLVPEPATVALLGLGGLLCLPRRRRAL